MKKKQFALTLLTLALLAGCGNPTPDSSVTPSSTTPSSESTPSSNTPESVTSSSKEDQNSEIITSYVHPQSAFPKAFFEDLKTAYAFKTEVKETSNNNTNTYQHESYWKNDRFSNKISANGKLIQFNTYGKNEIGQLVSQRRNVNNGVNNTRVYNPMSGEFYNWTDGYENGFSFFSWSDFERTDDTHFALDINNEDLLAGYEALSTQIYGNPGISLDEFIVESDGDKFISVSAKASFSDSYSYEYTLTDFEAGENATFEDRAKPFEGDQDTDFETRMAALRGNNYTMSFRTAVKGQDGTPSTLTYGKVYSDETGVYISTFDEENEEFAYGYIYGEEGTIIEVSKNEEGDYTKVGEEEEDIDIHDMFLPSLLIDSRCFTKSGRTYTMKDDIDEDPSVFISFDTQVTALDEFSLYFEDSVITMINQDDKGYDEAIYENVGTTKLPFTAEDLLDVSGTWSTCLAEGYDDLYSIYGELMEALPVPEGHTSAASWINLKEEEGDPDILASFNDRDDVDADITNYCAVLEELGFEKQDGMGEYGGTLFYAEPCINDVDTLVGVEVINIEGYFAIALSFISSAE